MSDIFHLNLLSCEHRYLNHEKKFLRIHVLHFFVYFNYGDFFSCHKSCTPPPLSDVYSPSRCHNCFASVGGGESAECEGCLSLCISLGSAWLPVQVCPSSHPVAAGIGFSPTALSGINSDYDFWFNLQYLTIVLNS